QQWLHDAPLLVDSVLAGEPDRVADQRGVQQHLIWDRMLPGEVPVEIYRACTLAVPAMRVHRHSQTRGGVEPDDEFARIRRVESGYVQPQLRRLTEDQPDLGLCHWKPLAGPDEDRYPLPAPVLDVQPQRGVRFGGRVGRDSVDALVPVVLTANVVGRV